MQWGVVRAVQLAHVLLIGAVGVVIEQGIEKPRKVQLIGVRH